MTISHGVLVSRVFVVAALVAGLVSAAVVLAVESASPRYVSQATFISTPLSGTGEPDRVLATQATVLESRSLREQVAAGLGVDPGSFTVAASPDRLAFAMEVEVEAGQRALARSAATAVVEIYVASVAANPAPTTSVAPLDPATEATAVRDPVLDALVAFAAGAVVAVGALLLLRTLRPRVRARYAESPAPVPLLGVPAGLRRGEDVDGLAVALSGPLAAIASRVNPGAERLELVIVPVTGGAVRVATLAAHRVDPSGEDRQHEDRQHHDRQLADQLLAAQRVDDEELDEQRLGEEQPDDAGDQRPVRHEPGPHGGAQPAEGGALRPSGLGRSVSVRVTEDRSSLLAADGSDDHGVVALVLARAGRDLEADVRRTVASVSPLATTVLVVLGSHDNGVVLPATASVPAAPLEPAGDGPAVKGQRTASTW